MFLTVAKYIRELALRKRMLPRLYSGACVIESSTSGVDNDEPILKKCLYDSIICAYANLHIIARFIIFPLFLFSSSSLSLSRREADWSAAEREKKAGPRKSVDSQKSITQGCSIIPRQRN